LYTKQSIRAENLPTSLVLVLFLSGVADTPCFVSSLSLSLSPRRSLLSRCHVDFI
jgi:hypothetical protein